MHVTIPSLRSISRSPNTCVSRRSPRSFCLLRTFVKIFFFRRLASFPRRRSRAIAFHLSSYPFDVAKTSYSIEINSTKTILRQQFRRREDLNLWSCFQNSRSPSECLKPLSHASVKKPIVFVMQYARRKFYTKRRAMLSEAQQAPRTSPRQQMEPTTMAQQ